MTEDLHRDLTLLAADADPAPIDTYDVIAKATTRNRNRRAGVASVLGALAVAGAMAATIGFGGGTPGDGGISAATSGSPTPTDTWRMCAGENETPCTPLTQTDDESRKLTAQLADVRAELVPTRFSVVEDGLDPDPLTFAAGQSDGLYMSWARLSDSVGTVHLTIKVSKAPAGATLTSYLPYLGQGPCTLGAYDCTARTLEDGTVARAETNNGPSAMEPNTMLSALRPDGTYVEVLALVPDTRPSAPFTLDELFEFATVFTY